MQRKRKCRICKKPAKYFTSCSKGFCSSECGSILALELLAKKREKEAKLKKKEFRERKAKLNDTVPNWTKKAQAAFNAYIRERDKNEPCISCGKLHNGREVFKASAFDAGHYRSVGSCPELRFEKHNCHRQCVKCNRDLSGNAVEFRIGLVKRIGLDKVEWLEGPHEQKRYRVQDLKEITAHYKSELRRLQKDNE